jgi:hypothetical protein
MGGLKNVPVIDGCQTATLNTEGLMDLLSADFARALKDFAAVLNDLKRLSALGDLPLSLHDKSTLRVRFPGCDAETVERLCDEVGVERGLIYQDEDFDALNGAELALLFPFAPSHVPSPETDIFSLHGPLKRQAPEELDWRHMMSLKRTETSPSHSKESLTGLDYNHVEENPWASSLSGYSSVEISDLGDRVFFPELPRMSIPVTTSASEGVEGIYKFLEECDRAER